jgi:hypothetical protein
MKRAAAVVTLTLGAIAIAGLSAAVQPKVTRAQAVKRLRGMLGARPTHVQLVWADERTTDVVLEWTAYAPHARIRPVGGHIGTTVASAYRGPAVAWMSAAGKGDMGVGSVRPPRGRHVLQVRSTSIPISLVQALSKDGARVRLTPVRVQPTVDRVEAIDKLHEWGDTKGRLQAIWLVWFRRGGRERLAWMAVALHARVPVLGCSLGKKCEPWYTSPLASFLNARSGKLIEARTINGWRPQLPPG